MDLERKDRMAVVKKSFSLDRLEDPAIFAEIDVEDSKKLYRLSCPLEESFLEANTVWW